MKMKKKGYAMGGMKKGYAMGGMKKKMKAGGGVKKMQAGGITQEQIDDPKRAVAAGDRMSEMRAKEAVMGKKKPTDNSTGSLDAAARTLPSGTSVEEERKAARAKKPMRPKKRPTAPLTSKRPESRPAMPMMKAGGMAKKGFKAGGVAKKGKAKGGKMGGKSKVRGAGIAQRGVRPAKMR